MDHTQSVTTVITEDPSIVARIHCNELVLSQAELAVLAAVSGVGELAARFPAGGELELVFKVNRYHQRPSKAPTWTVKAHWR